MRMKRQLYKTGNKQCLPCIETDEWTANKAHMKQIPFALVYSPKGDSTACASVNRNTYLCTESERDTYLHHAHG